MGEAAGPGKSASRRGWAVRVLPWVALGVAVVSAALGLVFGLRHMRRPGPSASPPQGKPSGGQSSPISIPKVTVGAGNKVTVTVTLSGGRTSWAVAIDDDIRPGQSLNPVAQYRVDNSLSYTFTNVENGPRIPFSVAALDQNGLPVAPVQKVFVDVYDTQGKHLGTQAGSGVQRVFSVTRAGGRLTVRRCQEDGGATVLHYGRQNGAAATVLDNGNVLTAGTGSGMAYDATSTGEGTWTLVRTSVRPAGAVEELC